MQRAEAAQGEERHVRDVLDGEPVDEVIVLTVGRVVHVLHAHDRCDGLCSESGSARTTISEVQVKLLLLKGLIDCTPMRNSVGGGHSCRVAVHG